MNIADIQEVKSLSAEELEPGESVEICRGDGLIIFVPIYGTGVVKRVDEPSKRGWDLAQESLEFRYKEVNAFVITNDNRDKTMLRFIVIKIKQGRK